MAIREIGTSITMNASDFKKEMSAVNSNLNVLKEEMKAVTAETADNADSVSALTAKQKLLNQMEEQQKVKVEALSKAYEKQVKATGENSKQADKLQKDLAKARAELAKTQNASEDNTQALREARTITARVADAQEELKKKLEKVAPLFKDVKKGAEIAGKGLELTGKAMGAVTKAAGAMAAAGLAATGAMAGLAVSGLKTLTEWAAEAASEVDEGGVVIDNRFAELHKNMVGLDSGAAAAKKALSTVLLPALNSLSGAGAELLEGFSADLEACEGDAGKMGEVVGEYLTKAVDLIREEMPELIQLGSDLLGGLVEGAVENLPELLETGEEIIGTLLDAIQQYAPELGDAAIQIIMSLGQFLIENAPELLASGMELVATLIQGLTSALPQLIPMAAQMIVQLVTGLVSNLPQMVKMGLELILAIVQGLTEAIPQLLAAVPGIIEELIGGFQAAWDDIKGIGKKIIDGILDGLKEAWGAVKSWFSGVVGGLTGTAHVSVATDGSHAGGLEYVPFDGYIAELHKGEQVLTASEAAAYRGGGASRVVNVNVSTAQLSPSTVDYLIGRVNAELGGAVT